MGAGVYSNRKIFSPLTSPPAPPPQQKLAAGIGPPGGSFLFQHPHICVLEMISVTRGSFCMLGYPGSPPLGAPNPLRTPPPTGNCMVAHVYHTSDHAELPDIAAYAYQDVHVWSALRPACAPTGPKKFRGGGQDLSEDAWLQTCAPYLLITPARTSWDTCRHLPKIFMTPPTPTRQTSS